MTNVIVHNNTAPTGASMQPVAGLLYYALPTPPGHWLPNADCVANREGCQSWEACSRSPQKEICATTSGTATDSPSPWTPPNCKKPIFIQPCAWQIPACADQADACLLGKNIYFTPYFPVEVTFPNPCAAGYLGSNETAKQTSAMCGGKCPAGHYCPTAVTLVPIPCPDGHYCDEGASTPKPCPAGTRTNPALAPMTSEGQCVECSPGTWCSVGSLVETPCSSGTFNNQSTQVAESVHRFRSAQSGESYLHPLPYSTCAHRLISHSCFHLLTSLLQGCVVYPTTSAAAQFLAAQSPWCQSPKDRNTFM